MELLRRSLRLLSLCTLCVWVLAFGAPVLAQMLAPVPAADDLHQVCSAQGVRWVDSQGQEVVPAGSAAQPVSGAELQSGGSDHCKRCLWACAPALPPAPLTVQTAPEVGLHRVPASWLHAPRTAHAWVRAPSRAPPLAA